MKQDIHSFKKLTPIILKHTTHKRKAVSPDYVSTFNKLVSEAYKINEKQLPYLSNK
jgi:hypothetical protein